MTSTQSTQSNASNESNESQIKNPTPESGPYLQKNPNEILKAEEWNQMQIEIHEHINHAYNELQALQAKIDTIKGELNKLNSQLEQCNKTKLDNSLPLTLSKERSAKDGELLTLQSYNDEAPYMNFYHLPGGASTANATRYGFIQGGLDRDKKPVFLLTSDNSAELHIHGSKVCINDRDILAEIDSLKKIIHVNSQSIKCSSLECTDEIKLGDFLFKWYPNGVNDGDKNNASKAAQGTSNILIKFNTYHWGSLLSPTCVDKLQIVRVRGENAPTLANGYAWCSDASPAGWGI
jgi:hypothetical protein